MSPLLKLLISTFAVSLRGKVRPGAVRGIFQSMVDLSDHDDLMWERIAALIHQL